MGKTKVRLEEVTIPLELLKPHPKNPNVHPENQIKGLSQSMKTYGQYYRILADENYIILGGHGKKMALEQNGEKEGRVTIIHGLTEKQKLKLLLEDNKIQSLSYINYGKVEEIIKEIGDTDIIGFPADYLDSIINDTSIDNIGVDLAAPAKSEENFTQERQEEQEREFAEIEGGASGARVFTCPHCGKESIL